MDKLSYLHNLKIEEQLIMEEAKAKAFHGDGKHDNFEWFLILSEEVGEVAMNINKASFEGACISRTAQENLEYEILQVMATCKMWLDELRKIEPEE